MARQATSKPESDRKLTDTGIAKISSGVLPTGTLLLSSRAPVRQLAIASMPAAINQGFIAMKCNERASNFFMLNSCQTNMVEIESRATATTATDLNKQNFRPHPRRAAAEGTHGRLHHQSRATLRSNHRQPPPIPSSPPFAIRCCRSC